MLAKKPMSTTVLGGILSVVLLSGNAFAQSKKKPAPPPKKPTNAPGTLGTKQMEGKEGQLNVAYTLKEEYFIGGYNITLTDVSYSTRSFPVGEEYYTPTSEQKFVVIRFLLQNPKKQDITIGSDLAKALFQVVATDNKTYEAEGTPYVFVDNPKLAPGKGYLLADLTLKPGQKSEPLVAVITVPSDLIVPKLIIKRGRFGTSEEVVRFDLRGKVKNDLGVFADPENPTTPRIEAPAEFGKPYTLSALQVTLEGLKRESGPIKDVEAEEGKEFLTGTVTIKNISHRGRPFWGDVKPVIILVDEDGEKTEFNQNFLRPSRTDEVAYNATVEPLEERKGVFYFPIRKGMKVKQILVQEYSFPDYRSRRLLYDASNL